jgi:hypothetical protein
MDGDPRQQTAETELYRHMMCSSGGLMLLIRLRAQLDRCPEDWLRRVASDPGSPELREQPAVVSTLGWLERKFGRINARRALRETAGVILGAHAV